MGWLYMQSLGGHAGPREYLDNQLTHENDQLKSRVLRSASTLDERQASPGG